MALSQHHGSYLQTFFIARTQTKKFCKTKIMASLKDTALHFGVSVQAISDYVKKHLDEINSDGVHAALHRGKWHFDNIAISRLEQMRGYHDGNGLPLTRTPATVDDFRAIITQLQADIANLNSRVTQLESKQRSWLDRVFND